MIPEPTTTASRNAVPTVSETNLRDNVAGCGPTSSTGDDAGGDDARVALAFVLIGRDRTVRADLPP
jgi:hypothetical protein